MLAPDPLAQFGDQRKKSDVVNNTTGTLAHEYQHLINAGRRLYVNNAEFFETVWLNEGLSHIAEELLYYKRERKGAAAEHRHHRTRGELADDRRLQRIPGRQPRPLRGVHRQADADERLRATTIRSRRAARRGISFAISPTIAARLYEQLFSPQTSLADRVAVLQDGSKFKSVIAGFASNPLAKKVTVDVTKVQLQGGDHAKVDYTVKFGGTSLPTQTGSAVLQNGTWKVGFASLCKLVALGGSTPSACKS